MCRILILYRPNISSIPDAQICKVDLMCSNIVTDHDFIWRPNDICDLDLPHPRKKVWLSSFDLGHKNGVNFSTKNKIMKHNKRKEK